MADRMHLHVAPPREITALLAELSRIRVKMGHRAKDDSRDLARRHEIFAELRTTYGVTWTAIADAAGTSESAVRHAVGRRNGKHA